MNTKEDQTPPAARPTQDAKRMGDVTICRNGYVEDLERELADARESLELQREVNALHRGEIDKLRDTLAKSEHEVDRLRAAVDESNIAELNRQIGEVTRERDELASKFTKLDKPKYSGLPMLDEVLSKPNPEFSAWVASLPPTYWTRYDLSAARIGWEAARTWNQSKP